MANSELWCVICERLVETEGMILARDFRGNGKASRATYLGKDVAHVVLNAQASKKYKPKVIVVPTIVQTKPVEVPAPEVVEIEEPQVLTEQPEVEVQQQVWVQEQDCEHTDPTRAVVLDWDDKGHFGNVQLPCGCGLFVSINGVEHFQVGDPVWVVKIVRNPLNPGYMGRYISRLVEEETEETGDEDGYSTDNI